MLNEIIYPVGKRVCITVRDLRLQGDYDLYIIPYMYPYDGRVRNRYPFTEYEKSAEGCKFYYTFEKFGRYSICFLRKADIENYFQLDENLLMREEVFAVDEKIPCPCLQKTDFHIHSTCSDGASPPEDICVYYRRAGFDAMAITDHNTMEGSETAIRIFKDYGGDMGIFLGEETHPEFFDPHIVNFAPRYSVNAKILSDLPAYKKKVEEYAREIGLTGSYAASKADALLRVKMIRESGGIAIWAHPFWKVFVNSQDLDLIDFMWENRVFDALERIGGNTVEDNNFQQVYFSSQKEAVPCVASSDSHSKDDLFNQFFTLVFSEKNDSESIKRAVLNGACVLAEQDAENAPVRLHGDFNQVQFARFWLDTVMPRLREEYEFDADGMAAISRGEKPSTAFKSISRCKRNLVYKV